MDYNQVKELIKMIEKTDFTNFELGIDGVSIVIQRGESSVKKAARPTVKSEYKGAEARETINEAEAEENLPAAGQSQIVSSPIVGTFYESSAPDKPAFVKKGDKVNKGDVLCIVEAMKFMNEIISEFSGIVEEVLVSDQDLVEFGQPLYRIV